MTATQSQHSRLQLCELQRSSDAEEIRLGEFDVVAAGAIPWQLRGGELHVLLIHRPRYDDWSWPKGKLDSGESIPECAIRELREEVGLRLSLGIPLAATAYSVKGKTKVVYYWAAKVDPALQAVPDGVECDELRWVTAAEAAALLTNPSDLAPLEDLRKAHQKQRLESLAFIILRHAKAKPRGKWTRAEGERPLAATGRRQAQAVARMLDAWQPGNVASSPWTRCVQTVTPYLVQHSLKLKTIRSITEHEAKRKPHKAQRAIEKLVAKSRSQVICTHRPVLPLIIEVLRSRVSAKVAAVLPAQDPFLDPGGVIVAQQAIGAKHQFVSVEIHAPYHD
ncbi:NUDIX hydrolase [Glutamicibacter sp. 287]|uniref:NUDIX hydrolase n=1 Tax=unclassified Glutamicibacter TaxID=2627139 RepID=UPI000BB8303D|nr:NUDIX hydrolase [Glutamicibacter sp. BW80]PCC29954.1 NUDIX hydrolase [Glutamicibacter sp. BW80]